MQTQSFAQLREPVFFVPGTAGRTTSMIDLAKAGPDGALIGGHSNRTAEDLERDYPGLQLGEFEDVTTTMENERKTEPVEIDAEAYAFALEVLPPHGYSGDSAGESFKMIERVSGRITTVFARLGKRFFKFNDLYTIRHNEIVAKIRASKAYAATPQTASASEEPSRA